MSSGYYWMTPPPSVSGDSKSVPATRKRRWRRPNKEGIAMEEKYLLILMSDEHNAAMVGATGQALVNTPNLDALAARGTQFTAA